MYNEQERNKLLAQTFEECGFRPPKNSHRVYGTLYHMIPDVVNYNCNVTRYPVLMNFLKSELAYVRSNVYTHISREILQLMLEEYLERNDFGYYEGITEDIVVIAQMKAIIHSYLTTYAEQVTHHDPFKCTYSYICTSGNLSVNITDLIINNYNFRGIISELLEIIDPLQESLTVVGKYLTLRHDLNIGEKWTNHQQLYTITLGRKLTRELSHIYTTTPADIIGSYLATKKETLVTELGSRENDVTCEIVKAYQRDAIVIRGKFNGDQYEIYHFYNYLKIELNQATYYATRTTGRTTQGIREDLQQLGVPEEICDSYL